MLTKNNVRKEKNIFVEAMHYSSLAFAICSHILQTSFLPQNDISLTFRYLIHYLLLAFLSGWSQIYCYYFGRFKSL